MSPKFPLDRIREISGKRKCSFMSDDELRGIIRDIGG